MKAELLKPFGVKELFAENRVLTLKEMQKAVGGYIELIHLPIENKLLIVNEDGRLLGLARNAAATIKMLENGKFDIIVGNAILCDIGMVD